MGGRGTRAASRRFVYDVKVKQPECDFVSTEAYRRRMDVINRGLGAVHSLVSASHYLILVCRGLQLRVGPHSVPTGLPCMRWSIRNVTRLLDTVICHQGGSKESAHRTIADDLVG